MINEKKVSYSTTNTYNTLNEHTEKTKNVWVVFHGIGYLSRYFLKYFKQLDPEKNYVIAPQAPSKYYLNGKYEHVGASWATREHTQAEMDNILNYLDEVWKSEQLDKSKNLILFGYSQGVSIATRYLARRNINCSRLILNSGRIPKELNPSDFESFTGKVSFIYGNEDPFINEKFLAEEKRRIEKLFPKRLEFLPFDGGHKVNREIILKLAQE